MDRTGAIGDLIPEIVRGRLSALPAAASYWVALSGGCDSTVLLHVMHQLRLAQLVRGVHVHHGLYNEADSWAAFCERQCAELGIPLTVLRLQARAPEGQSQEAWARRMRYEALRPLLGSDEALLTAHHQQDQAETVLLQLLRGAGPAGLAAMPACSGFGAGWHLRPLIDVPRAALRAYAEANALQWVDDHSNTDIRFDRNYLRQRVLPLVVERWPQYARTLARAARWQAGASVLLRELAAEDLQCVAGSRAGCVSVTALRLLSESRRRNVLRHWLAQRQLPVPSAAHFEQLLGLLAARRDACACVRWPGAEVRRYRDDLHATVPLAPHDATQVWEWDPRVSLQLPLGTLSARRCRGEGLSSEAAAREPLVVHFRRGGERCHRGAKGGGKTLKGLLQERGVPPWLRDRIPLVCAGAELAAIADWWVCASFRARPDEEGWVIEWAPIGDS
ncbi:MAG: tRNA lysidine(34) synthetase TilS [Chromatiales bacterium]